MNRCDVEANEVSSTAVSARIFRDLALVVESLLFRVASMSMGSVFF